ncbi:MAG: haloacid dehalogenase-like hydrolase [Oscillospiraceae bacterium]|nr:haloacid dehalogenase-like hydrolase [Oscillospiraceae bacterium]
MNVYDFDNTLYKGESGIALFFFYLRKRPSLLRMMPIVVQGGLKYKLGLVKIDEVARRYAKYIEVFLRGIQDYKADAKEFWDRYEHRLQPFYKNMQKSDDLIVSASPEQSLEEVCKRMGVSRWIGTRIDEENARLTFVCFRENKAKAFLERYPNEQIDNLYTDSMYDTPLMELSKHVYLVRKGKLIKIK